MTHHIFGALAAQPVNSANAQHEWRNLIESADGARLFRDEDRAKIDNLKGRYAMGLVSPDDAQREVVALLAAGSAADKALDAIVPLFAPDDVIELRALPDGVSCNGRLSVPGERAEMVAFIRRHIGRSNLYFGANPRRKGLAGTNTPGKAADVAARRAAFLDLDRKDAPDVDPEWSRTRKELEAQGAALVVETGNGYHVWLNHEPLDGAPLPASVAPLASAMARIGSDNVADLPRIARLPFTVNLPNASKRKRGNTVALALPVPSKGAAPLLEGATPTVEALCLAVEAVADRLRLPGKGGAGGSSASTTGSGGGKKKGWAAPSADLLRMALEELPNDQGHFDDRFNWVSVCAAVKGAVMEGGFEDAGREVWLDFCERWGGGDATEDARVWDTMNAPHNGWGTLMRWLEQANPAGAQRVKDAMAQAAFPPLPASFGLQPVKSFDPTKIPPREWLYGYTAIRRFLSMLVGPGGAGKSALLMAEAVAMATGKVLLPGDKPHHELRVLYHNAEDDLAEQQRRLAACMSHYSISHADLGNRLFLSSGRDMDLQLARQGREGPIINEDAVKRLTELLIAHKIDVLILDPFGAMHTLPENSNEDMNALMRAFRKIMDATEAAIILAHHVGKAAAMNSVATANASRGASAITDAARFVRALNPMGKEDAKKLRVSANECRFLVRADNGKANLAPAADARWFRLEGVKLHNGTKAYPDGDHTQTVTVWEPPVPKTLNTPANVQLAYEAISVADVEARRLDAKSPGWVGFLFADALGLDVGAPGVAAGSLDPDQTLNRAEIAALIGAGTKQGWIIRAKEYIPSNQRKGDVFAAGETPPDAGPDTADADSD